MPRDHRMETVDAITELQSGPTAGPKFARHLEYAFRGMLDLWQHDPEAFERCLWDAAMRYPSLDLASTDVLMHWAEEIAQQYAHGHMTVLRFTTGWKVVLHTVRLPEDNDALSAIHQSATLDEALRDLIGRALLQYSNLRLTGFAESAR